MKIKKTAKRIIVCAVFMLSFCLSVVAFADDTFIIHNSNYYGTYDSTAGNAGRVIVSSDKVSVFAYYDNVRGYISGSSVDGALTNRDYSFTFSKVVSSQSDGTTPGSVILEDVAISGKTDVTTGLFLIIKSIELTPDGQNKESYLLKK